MLFLDEYQKLALRTASNNAELKHRFANWALGLAGEAGEVGDLIKKFAFHGHELDVKKVEAELGDVLWYVAVLANELGLKLSAIAVTNINKLAARYPEGFTEWDSQHRKS